MFRADHAVRKEAENVRKKTRERNINMQTNICGDTAESLVAKPSKRHYLVINQLYLIICEIKVIITAMFII